MDWKIRGCRGKLTGWSSFSGKVRKTVPARPRPGTQRPLPEERPGVAGGKRDKNRRARIECLLEAAERLFLEHGLENVTIDDITREAGVAKGSFYRYFTSKHDLSRSLFAALEERVLGAFARAERKLRDAAGPAAVRAAYLRLGRELAAIVMGEPSLARLYLQESRSPEVDARTPVRKLEREISAAARRLTDVAMGHGLLRKVHPQVSSLSVIGAVERLLYAYFHGELEVDPLVAMQDLVLIVLDGIRVDDGAARPQRPMRRSRS
jgi:AcrR family transcriptional regulator